MCLDPVLCHRFLSSQYLISYLGKREYCVWFKKSLSARGDQVIFLSIIFLADIIYYIIVRNTLT